MNDTRKHTAPIAIAGACAVMLLLILGTAWLGRSSRRDTEEAVRTVSRLYLDELAVRCEQVVEANLEERIHDVQAALELLTEEDLSDREHMEAYEARMKKLFKLDKFAFVDAGGTIYTSTGTQNNIDEYPFDHRTIDGPEISIKNLDTPDKKVIIAVPADRTAYNGEKLTACFMEIDMQDMLAGVSMQSQEGDTTFSNLYTSGGVALSNTILGGLAVEDNLLDALARAEYDRGYSLEKVQEDFKNLTGGEATFTYNGIHETLAYAPVEGTDWLLTYLIRESVISEKISYISEGAVRRSVIQSLVMIAVMLGVFSCFAAQSRKNALLRLEKETLDTENRVKQEELDERIVIQKKLEQQSRALSDALTAAEEANRAKTAFLSSMSHEIRTPMNAIIGLDNIALNDPGVPERTRGYLEKIGSSAEHLLNLINDILDMSRIESGRLTLRNEEFSFRKLLEAINTMVGGQCADKGLEYQCRVNGQIDDNYIGDDLKLRQVLINILGNAVKFTPEGGRIDLAVERKASYNGQTTLQFTITDTGIGMSPEFLPHIFDTFTQEDSSMTNRYGSSGLGLSITKSIVEMMNGTIEVESEKGKGSTFTVTVTLMDPDRDDAGGVEREIRPAEMNVLIVDDDPAACEDARLELEKAGIAPETASSGGEALGMVKLQHARMTPYNLILVERQMQDMDGVETARQIREITGSDPVVIFLTSRHSDDMPAETPEAGVDSVLAGPLSASAVMEKFREAMSRKSMDHDHHPHVADLTGRRILVAEDVQINAEIMTMVLQARQMVPDLAVNGRVAVEMFADHPAGYYAAVLMDMRMPEMDGLEAAKTIRAMDRPDAKEIPIIALTANAFDEDVQRSMQAGMSAHLSKPVQPEVLYETLESLIRD